MQDTVVSPVADLGRPPILHTGYIVSPRADLFWFLGLPFLALTFALTCQDRMSAMAMASVGLWINSPHIMSTILRAYGVAEDRQRFKDRLIIGPIVIFTWVAVGLAYAPLTLVLVQQIWNHQHFMMQIHGFTRIYDFKAKAGAPNTGRWDLLLNFSVYLSMFLSAPLFASFWSRELLRLQVPLTAHAVQMIQLGGWLFLAAVGIGYLGHVLRSVREGYAVNPIKYLFLAANAGTLYYVAWSTNSVLVYSVTNQIMHGLQYFVIVYYFTQRRLAQTGQTRGLVHWLVSPGHAIPFFLFCVMMVGVQQLLLMRPLGEFGFGAVGTMSGFMAVSSPAASDLSDPYIYFATAVLGIPGGIHLYFDSFIWKVRDKKSQAAL